MGDKGTAIYSGDQLQRDQSNKTIKRVKNAMDVQGEKRAKYYNIILDREAARLIISNSKNTGLNEPKVRRLKTSPSVSTPNSVDHH